MLFAARSPFELESRLVFRVDPVELAPSSGQSKLRRQAQATLIFLSHLVADWDATKSSCPLLYLKLNRAGANVFVRTLIRVIEVNLSPRRGTRSCGAKSVPNCESSRAIGALSGCSYPSGELEKVQVKQGCRFAELRANKQLIFALQSGPIQAHLDLQPRGGNPFAS